MNIEEFYRVIIVICGAWMLVHFTFRAVFLPKRANMLVKNIVCVIASLGTWLVTVGILGEFSALIPPLVLSLVAIAAFDAAMWALGLKVCNFFRRKHENENAFSALRNPPQLVPRQPVRADWTSRVRLENRRGEIGERRNRVYP